MLSKIDAITDDVQIIIFVAYEHELVDLNQFGKYDVIFFEHDILHARYPTH